ncbi:hypothetical protein DFH27DRAFT_336788 [Peziza echinospora]|nr:hypothetical protein DFH27DRAFT_336788 [Peziza echinospora]
MDGPPHAHHNTSRKHEPVFFPCLVLSVFLFLSFVLSSCVVFLNIVTAFLIFLFSLSLCVCFVLFRFFHFLFFSSPVFSFSSSVRDGHGGCLWFCSRLVHMVYLVMKGMTSAIYAHAMLCYILKPTWLPMVTLCLI